MNRPKRPSARRVDPEALAAELAEDERAPSSLEADDLEDALGRVLTLEARIAELEEDGREQARRFAALEVERLGRDAYAEAFGPQAELASRPPRVERPPRHERQRLEARPNDATLLLAWISGRLGLEGEELAASFVARVRELEARS